MLPLDSSRWETLEQVSGTASNIPVLLQQLQAHAADAEAWCGDLWEALWHQNTTYTASHAAVPHLVEIARRSGTSTALRECVLFVGAIAAWTEEEDVPEDLKADYEAGLEAVRNMALEVLASGASEVETFIHLLACLAGVSGWTVLARELEQLADRELDTRCPACDVPVALPVEEDGVSTTHDDYLFHPGRPRLPVAAVSGETLAEGEALPGGAAGPLAQLRVLSLRAGQHAVAHWLCCLGGIAKCPHCGEKFVLLEALARDVA